MNRYKDVEPDIRFECVQALGRCVAGYPSLFLSDLKLKYLGWLLNDKARKRGMGGGRGGVGKGAGEEEQRRKKVHTSRDHVHDC